MIPVRSLVGGSLVLNSKEMEMSKSAREVRSLILYEKPTP